MGGTLAEWITRYEPHARLRLSASTWSRRRYELRDLRQAFGDRPFVELTGAEVETWAAARIAGGIRPVSVNAALRTLRVLVSYAREAGEPVGLRFRMLPERASRARRVKLWTAAEVEQLIHQARQLSPELVPLLVFLANTGCRKAEALALTWDKVHEARGVVEISTLADEEDGADLWTPKSARVREVPINDVLSALLPTLPRASRFVFPNRKGGQYAVWPQRAFDRAREAAGIVGGPHTLRHTYALHFLATTPDLLLLARILGHSHQRVTEIYSHLLPEHLARGRRAVRFGDAVLLAPPGSEAPAAPPATVVRPLAEALERARTWGASLWSAVKVARSAVENHMTEQKSTPKRSA